MSSGRIARRFDAASVHQAWQVVSVSSAAWCLAHGFTRGVAARCIQPRSTRDRAMLRQKKKSFAYHTFLLERLIEPQHLWERGAVRIRAGRRVQPGRRDSGFVAVVDAAAEEIMDVVAAAVNAAARAYLLHGSAYYTPLTTRAFGGAHWCAGTRS
ncbi:hypothetical protein GGX14DRAFT_401570 [Mycena pura]|uniref:Uncharacterized protein n=1 Tax=Mycena pura TaxID=153505 RepID=A0AAD6V718_9AGAR|nr:hypothetical protein GGX14DRAFT_401570 [Mycena pura]